MKEYYENVKVFLTMVKLLANNVKNLNDDVNNNYKICQYICQKIIDSSNINLELINKDNIPKDDNFLLVSNHRSFFDIILYLATVDEIISFVTAEELYKMPYLRDYIKSINCISVQRNTIDRKSLKEEINMMSSHLQTNNLVLFPEGECEYHTNEIQEFKKGGFISACRSNPLIVPAYIDINNMSSINRWYVPIGDVSIEFGEAFRPSEIQNKKTNASFLAQYSYERVQSLKK